MPIITNDSRIVPILTSASNWEVHNYKPPNVSKHSLLCGESGMVLYNFVCGQTITLDRFYEDANNKLIEILSQQNKIAHYSFCIGVAGFFWAYNFFIKNNFINTGINITHNYINLFKISIGELKQNNYDYLHGSLGICLNALENIDENAQQYLNEVINILSINADKNLYGISWKSIEFESKTEMYNLGLSHGLPSIITIISYIYEAGIAKEKCLELLQGSINWLLQQKLPEGSLSIFPYSVPVEKPENYQPAPSRLAWCYGDLGIARSLWLAGKATDNETWQQEAINIMLHASKRRNLEENKVYDAGLCHGSAGIAHIFNRFYQDTKIEEFKTAATYWYKVTLDFARFEDGIGGYKKYVPSQNESEEGRWENSAGILEGSAGIGLALLAAISNEEPKWDRCLLLS